ncbi:MAG: hypothetical protein IPP40_15485 [bacterium]|nr:hypothetical protein [bacterium]
MDIVELARIPKKPVPGTAKGKMYKGFWTPRHIVQISFAALNVFLGIQFWFFVRALQEGGTGRFLPALPELRGGCRFRD